ncbi:MAG: GTP-sensing pleiotropic transcriptional regulator CodY [Thermovirgaceae bacterium]
MKTPKELIDSRAKIMDISAMQDLLERTRAVNRMLQNKKDTGSQDFQRLAKLLCEQSAANVYMIDREGKILGYGWTSEYDCTIMEDLLKTGYMPEDYVEKLNQIHESVLNHTDHGMCAYSDKPCTYSNKHVVYIPINGGGERLGTLILARFGHPFDTRDLVLGEYLSTVVGLEILYARARQIEQRARESLVVQMALRALSYSEVESIKHIVRELGSAEGVVIASKVADAAGVTRSVIVNALRKLESAGIIESRSLGMKGTYIKVLSPLFMEQIGFPED